MGRMVTVELTHRGEYFGRLGPFEVAGPYWQATEEVLAAVEVPAVVLRLVDGRGAEGGAYGGEVRYHVEALERPPGREPRPMEAGTAAVLGPAEGRAPWARPDGLREALAWAAARVDGAGPVRQVRTWNLSGLFRLPGGAWLKTTAPAFNAAEGEVIALFGSVDAALVPKVIAADAAAGRLLLEAVPGEDCWGPSADTVAEVVPRLVAAQAALAADGRAASAGLRDRTPRALLAQLEVLLDRLPEETDLSAGERVEVARLVAELPDVIEELEGCGLPVTLLHGDFHPGNWRAEAGGPAVVLDFADACLGHPALDGLRARDFLTPAAWSHHAQVWSAAWQAHAPGSRPGRALELAEPLYHLAYALRYQEFLDHIETSERPYHEGDPAAELRAALACGHARHRS
ncbi:aminoglycoside phosphotransferase family protein [Streptomyces sp. NRRL WC-3742]|uniref:aminoglycoside phosphotransferase family protein n=1 Tax=Streptomyces sp. NRRL WC-3742 TaxID=1463934 RepID=UPI0004C47F64|nr:aminoglycoside phosphotransferase family protein [Streptomyces sp. NRRL WC-3742]